MSLWEETMEMLEAHGKTFKDVKYIQGLNFGITKENFEKVAKKTDYYSGYSTADVAYDLVVAGDNWWLERHGYDGCEGWWEYNEKPEQIREIKEINHLAGGMWNNLAELNETEVEE